MSDTTNTGAPASASIDSIVNETVSNLSDSGSEGTESVSDSPTLDAEQSAEPQLTDAQPPAALPQDELAAELGLKPGAKDNRIPYSRVKKIVENAKAQHAKEVEQHVARLQQFEQERQQYQAQLQALQIADQDPARFLQAMAQADPRYAELLKRAFEQAQDTEAERPQPDLQLADGTLIYSAAQQELLADWKAAQRASALERQFNEQFGPIMQEHRAQQHIKAAVPKVQAQLAEAETWPQFNESRQEILNALRADRSLSLEAAYRKVVFPKLRQTRDSMRAEILAEINRKPAAVSRTTPGAAPTASKPAAFSIDSIVDEIVAGLE